MKQTPASSSPRFAALISQLKKLFRTHDENSHAVTSALDELKSRYPLPPVQLIPKGVWPHEPNCLVSIQTHIKSTFADAVNLLKSTGRDVSLEDEKYLHYLLTHICGWSATYPQHCEDPWVDFFHVQYPQLQGLVPILDSITYPEELEEFPEDNYFREPRFILLATSDQYYIYDAHEMSQQQLFFAGDTLRDVYIGLKEWRWAESSEDMWEIVKDEGEYRDPCDYFLTYERKENGNFAIIGSTEEILGKSQKGF